MAKLQFATLSNLQEFFPHRTQPAYQVLQTSAIK